MSEIKVKTAHIEKLKSLGVYDKWLANVKAQWEGDGDSIDGDGDWEALLNSSFSYVDTFEGWQFWCDIEEQ